MKIAEGQKLVMIGDSITDTGRTRPVGEGEGNVGNGYVSMVAALIDAVYVERRIRVLNLGISGNTVRDLKKRWQTDVTDLKPDWLSVMIGTNDVWRQYDAVKFPERSVYAEEYEATYNELLTLTRPTLKGLVLMTPFYIEPDKSEPMRAKMDEYGKIVKRLASKFDAIFVDTQAAYDQALKHLYPHVYAKDRVHPNPGGHGVIARAFLKSIGFEF